jgi:hypothetical protein
LALLAAVVLLGGPAYAGPAESITRYDTQLRIRPDGQLRITETIGYDFGSSSRHGIFRRIPDRFRYDNTHDRVYPVTGLTVTRDGNPEPVRTSSDGGYLVLTIGDKNRTISGQHTYVIGYTVRGALNHFPDHEELFWNVVGTEWPVPIATATATVTGPAQVQEVQCFAGPNGSRLGCATKAGDGAIATFRQSDLGSREGLTAVVAFPAGSVRNTAPVLVDRHDLGTAFTATPGTVGGMVGLGLLGVAAYWAYLHAGGTPWQIG